MSDKTGIEWTDATWNPIRGCSRVSEGCRNCYAERVAARFSGKGLPYEGLTRDGKWNGQIRVVEDALLQPLKWKAPRRIFVNSMSDLFHANVTDETIDRVFAVMALAKQHVFQILTKRPERMAEYFKPREIEERIANAAKKIDPTLNPRAYSFQVAALPLPNVWLGVSVEDQQRADERIPHLLRTPAAVRWLSCEPMLGAVDLDTWIASTIKCGTCGVKFEKGDLSQVIYHEGDHSGDAPRPATGVKGIRMNPIRWVVCGGESGPNARPMHPDWARSLRDQCQAAGVPFFFKQWGEWGPSAQFKKEDFTRKAGLDVHEVLYCKRDATGFEPLGEGYDAKQVMTFRVGKRAAGRVLDGRTWNEFPGTATTEGTENTENGKAVTA